MKKSISFVLALILALTLILVPVKNGNIAYAWGRDKATREKYVDQEYLDSLKNKYFGSYTQQGTIVEPEAIYDKNRIDIRYDSPTVFVKVKANENDIIEYYIAAGGDMMARGIVDYEINSEGIANFEVDLPVEGEMLFTVVVTRGNESFRNSIKFTHSLLRFFSGGNVVKPSISGE